MAERNIRLTVEYKGTAFCGWQIQKRGSTIQGEITEAIFKVTGARVNLIGAGRTDAGVHANGQVANFRIDHDIEPARYRDAINYYLPDDIRVLYSEDAELEFHARFDARFRRYRYLVGLKRSALYRQYRYELTQKVDFQRLQEAAALIVGEHDFSPFCVVASRQESNLCRIEFSRWFARGGLLLYEIRGNRFLHSMVRSLVGAMLNLAEGKPDENRHNLTLERFADIIEFAGEERIVFTAPPHGLYLVSVGYGSLLPASGQNGNLTKSESND